MKVMSIELSDNTLERLAGLLAKPNIPIEIDLWSPKEAAEYFKVSQRQFSERIALKDGFPKPLRIKTDKGRGHPRWRALDVIKWADEQR